MKNSDREYRRNFDWMKFFMDQEHELVPPLPPREETLTTMTYDFMKDGEELAYGPRSEEQMQDDERRRKRQELEEAMEESQN